jgi:hypothetical protein
LLLATFTISGHEFDPSTVIPAHMSFGAQAREPFPGTNVFFINEYTPDQVGTVFEAPSDLVMEMAPIFSDPSGVIGAVTMSDTFFWNVSDFWDLSQFIMPHVPQRGLGLEGYLVTRITQTVDYITWTMNGSDLNGNAQQSVRLYGEVVPEPSTLAAIAIACFFLRCVDSSGHRGSCRVKGRGIKVSAGDLLS